MGTGPAGERQRALAERTQARVPEPAWRAPSGRCRPPGAPTGRQARPRQSTPSEQQRRCAGTVAATPGRTRGPESPPRRERGCKCQGLGLRRATRVSLATVPEKGRELSGVSRGENEIEKKANFGAPPRPWFLVCWRP